jgi:hypothetical protein
MHTYTRFALCALMAALASATGASRLAQAADITMVKVFSSYPGGYNGEIAATIDDGGTGLTLFTFKDSRGTKKAFTVEEIRNGVVLLNVRGKNVLKVSGPNFTAQEGGEVILTFLKGFFGSDRRELRVEYVKRPGGPTDWLLQTNDPQGRDPFDTVSVYVNKKLGVPTSVGSIRLKAGETLVRRYNPNDLPQPGAEPGDGSGGFEALPALIYY